MSSERNENSKEIQRELEFSKFSSFQILMYPFKKKKKPPDMSIQLPLTNEFGYDFLFFQSTSLLLAHYLFIFELPIQSIAPSFSPIPIDPFVLKSLGFFVSSSNWYGDTFSVLNCKVLRCSFQKIGSSGLLKGISGSRSAPLEVDFNPMKLIDRLLSINSGVNILCSSISCWYFHHICNSIANKVKVYAHFLHSSFFLSLFYPSFLGIRSFQWSAMSNWDSIYNVDSIAATKAYLSVFFFFTK